MPRRNRAKPEPPRPLSPSAGAVRTEGDWHVRPIPAARADKAYRCPGCVQEIPPGTPHVVTWPVDPGGLDERRHWHSACWRARHRRGPA